MSEDTKSKKKSSTRLRRRPKDGEDRSSDNDSGEESDTIFDQQSDYESAEEDHGDLTQDTSTSFHETENEGEDDVEYSTQEERPIIILTRETAALDISGDQSTDLEPDLEVTPENSQKQEPEQDVVKQDEKAKDEGEEEEEEAEGGKDDDESLEQRGDGDGQEEEENLDDDEDLKNPQYIPRTGAYYQHDVRNEGKKDTRPRRDRRLWKEDGHKWLHDKYNEEEQAPKSQWDLMNYHGYDIRDPTEQDSGDQRPRRGRGRGYRGGRGPGVGGGGRGRGRGLRYQRSPEEDGGGDRRPEPRRYMRTDDLEPRRKERTTEDFPALPVHGETSDPMNRTSHTDKAWGRHVRNEDESRGDGGRNGRNEQMSGGGGGVMAPPMKMKYQSEKTYYERDDADQSGDQSFKNVTADFRYRPSGNRSVNAYWGKGSENVGGKQTVRAHRAEESEFLGENHGNRTVSAYRAEESDHVGRKELPRSYVDRKESPTVPKREPLHDTPRSKSSSYGDQRNYYQLEFVNTNYQAEGEEGRGVDEGVEEEEDRLNSGEEEEKEFPVKSERPESPRKTYSQDRRQRSRPQQGVGRGGRSVVEDVETDTAAPLVNLQIKVEGSERIVQYSNDEYEDDQEHEDHRQRFADEREEEEDAEDEQRTDRLEQRTRPKRYSSQRQRGQDTSSASQSYYEKGVQPAAESSNGRARPISPHQRGAPPPQERSPNQAPTPRRATPQANQAVQSSMPGNLQNLMQQGMMMPPDAHGIRPPHLPSPAFFQQQQGPPPPYYVPPMVNYGSPQYQPMATPMQFQHYPMGIPQPLPPAVPNNPPAPPQPPQSQAPPSSMQQVGGITYYSPLMQPLHQPPHKRPSNPITIESPPDIHPR